MIRKICFVFIVLSGAARAQGVRYDIPPILSPKGVPAANVQVTLCAGSGAITGTTCSPQTQSFSGITLTTPCPQGFPVTLAAASVCQSISDGLGNAGFWLAPGTYIYCLNGTNINGQCYNLTVPVGAASSGLIPSLNGEVNAAAQPGATAVAQANAADTAIGNGTRGTMLFPAGFSSSLDFWQNPAMTWHEDHGIFDRRGSFFSNVPGSFYSPFQFLDLKLSSLGGSEVFTAGNFIMYHPQGGTNTNGGPKTTFSGLSVLGYKGGIGQDDLLFADQSCFGQGDCIAVFATTDGEGNCSEGGGECTEVFRGQVDQGAYVLGVFTATVSSYSGGTLSFTSPTNPAKVATGKYIIDTAAAKIYTTGTLVSVSGTPPTMVGSGTSWATNLTAGAHTDLCFSHDADTLSGLKFVIPISSITDDTHLVLNYAINNTNRSYPTTVTNGDTYKIFRCNQITTAPVPYTLNTLTLPTGTGYQGFAATDTIEVPLGYQYTSTVARLIQNSITPSPYASGGISGLAINNIGARNAGDMIKVLGNWSRVIDVVTAPVAGDDQNHAEVIWLPVGVNNNPIIRNDSTTDNPIIYRQFNGGGTQFDQFAFAPSTEDFTVGNNISGVKAKLNANTGNATLAGTITTYNGTATAGNGIAAVYGATSQRTESAADTNVLTFTPPAATGSYRVRFTMAVSAQNTATLGWTATWKDSNGVAQSPANLALFTSGTAAPALTVSAATNGNYYGYIDIDVDNSATAIVVKLTFSGTSFTAKVSATVERII